MTSLHMHSQGNRIQDERPIVTLLHNDVENIEKMFLRHDLDRRGVEAYGSKRLVVLPCTLMRERKKMTTELNHQKALKFLQDSPTNPPRIYPEGGDSEVASCCYTEGYDTTRSNSRSEIRAGESATDWQNIQFRQSLSLNSALLEELVDDGDDVDLDMDFVPFGFSESETIEKKDSSDSSFSSWTLDEITHAFNNTYFLPVFLSSLALAVIYKLIQRRL